MSDMDWIVRRRRRKRKKRGDVCLLIAKRMDAPLEVSCDMSSLIVALIEISKSREEAKGEMQVYA